MCPKAVGVFFQSENGLIGTGAPPEEGMALPMLTDAGGKPVTALPGACIFDSAMSFGLIRGGHVDLTVLGGLQVDETGLLANWTIPGKMVPGMGGAMDLVTGAKRVIVAMQHAAKGKSKIVKRCTLPITSARPVDMVVTDLAVIAFPNGRATLIETAPSVIDCGCGQGDRGRTDRSGPCAGNGPRHEVEPAISYPFSINLDRKELTEDDPRLHRKNSRFSCQTL